MRAHSLMMRRVGLAIAMFAIAACGGDDGEPSAPSGGARQGAIVAELDGDAIVIRNDADFDVRVAAVESEFLRNGLALWCFGFDDCGTAVAGQAAARLRLSEVPGYLPGRTEVLVHWWRPEHRGPEGSAPVQTFPLHLAH